MKKKILLLILSTFIIKGSCTQYLGGLVNFCPEVEQQCFMNMLNTDLQSQVLSSALDCSIITDAISGMPNLNSLQRNASKIVTDIVNSYLLKHGTSGCDSLVQTYLGYSQNYCGGSIMNQCSRLLGSCDVAMSNIANVIAWGRQVGDEAVDAYNKTVDWGRQVGDGAVDAYNKTVDWGRGAANTISSWFRF